MSNGCGRSMASADVASINKSLVASSSALNRVVPALDGLVGAMDTAAEELRTAHRMKYRMVV